MATISLMSSSAFPSPEVSCFTTSMKASLWVGNSISFSILAPAVVLWVMNPPAPMRSQLPFAMTSSLSISMS